jgi:acyl-CoA synthetase (AMP-forming)/AMP-acid ligase II
VGDQDVDDAIRSGAESVYPEEVEAVHIHRVAA